MHNFTVRRKKLAFRPVSTEELSQEESMLEKGAERDEDDGCSTTAVGISNRLRCTGDESVGGAVRGLFVQLISMKTALWVQVFHSDSAERLASSVPQPPPGLSPAAASFLAPELGAVCVAVPTPFPPGIAQTTLIDGNSDSQTAFARGLSYRLVKFLRSIEHQQPISVTVCCGIATEEQDQFRMIADITVSKTVYAAACRLIEESLNTT